MSKSPKRKPTQRRLPDQVGRARAAHEQELRRAVRHQKRIKQLNQQLTRAIKAADRSTRELHAYLGAIVGAYEVVPQQQELERV